MNLNRRTFLKQITAAGTALALNSLTGCQSKNFRHKDTQTQPNILFIFPDQQRWDTVGCYGLPIFPGLTPNLDRLAGDGVRFEYAFTAQPICGPARACLQTGRYATETGCYTNDLALRLNEKTMAHYLSTAGYEVGYIGKWHLASNHTFGYWAGQGEVLDYLHGPVPPNRRGGYKDFWLARDALEFFTKPNEGCIFDMAGNKREYHNRYRVDAQTDWLIEYLRTRSMERPFFLFASYLEPHQQEDETRFVGPIGWAERYKNFNPPGDLIGREALPWRKELPEYLACCASLDQNLGRILAELEHLGLADNTLVIYSTDHADNFRTRSRRGPTFNSGVDKASCHDNSCRIPLIIRGPGFRGGRVVRELVSTPDMTATVLTAAGVPVPVLMRGHPLQPLVQGKNACWQKEVFIQISNHSGAFEGEAICGRAIRTAKWKYAVAASPERDRCPDSDIYIEDFLYDLEKDPYEHHNLVGDPALAAVRAELCSTLKQRMIAAGETEPAIRPKI